MSYHCNEPFRESLVDSVGSDTLKEVIIVQHAKNLLDHISMDSETTIFCSDDLPPLPKPTANIQNEKDSSIETSNLDTINKC